MALESFLDVLECEGCMSQQAVFRAPAERTNVAQSIVSPVSSRDAYQPHSVAGEGAGPLPASTVRILPPKERPREPPRRLCLLDPKVPVDGSFATKLL